jgi:alcohol dehydrogenase (NADP+)
VAFKPEVAGFPSSGEDFLPLSEVPLTETWAALQDCVRAGLSRNIGVSNFSMEKLGALLESAEMPPTNNQIELHPLLQQKEMLEFCRDKGVMLTAYSPLGSTDRPERLKKPEDPELMDDPVITAVAEKHGATPAQVLIAWSLHRDTAVIPKSVTPARIMENFESAKLNLDDEDMNAIAGLDRHYRFVDGTFWESMPGSPYTAKGLWDE